MFNLLRKSGSSPDVVVTRLLRNEGRMAQHATVRRRRCGDGDGDGDGEDDGPNGCPDFNHVFGCCDQSALLAMACAHGTVTLHNHLTGWTDAMY